MAVTNTELDPQFLKALGYLWSKSPDSTAKLKKMLDDAIELSMKKKQEPKIGLDKSAAGPKGKHLAKITKSHDLKRKEKDLAEKRQFEKVQKDLEELDQEAPKKSRLDRSSSPTTAFLSADSKLKSESSGSPLASSDGKDFALEMDDLACAICKGFHPDKGTPVECQECHNMYHKECHQPPISHQDANDPRCVWYCSWCTKNMKKVAKQFNSKPSTASPNPVRDRINSLESKNISAFVTPFKRNEVKATLQSSSGNGSSGGSLAGWAALSGKSIQSSSSASNTSAISKPSSIPPSPLAQKSSVSSSFLHSKEKRDKSAKNSKAGPKLAVSDAWAEALGADLPPAPTGSSKVGSHKSGLKSSSSWGNKFSMFPKASASTGSRSTKANTPPGVNAEKRLQMIKKKAKMNPKKSKI